MKSLTTRLLGLAAASAMMAVSFAGSAGAASIYAGIVSSPEVVGDFAAWQLAAGPATLETFDDNISSAQEIELIDGVLKSKTNAWPDTAPAFMRHRVLGEAFDVYWGDDRFQSFTWTFSDPISAIFADFSNFDSNSTTGLFISFEENGTNNSIKISDYVSNLSPGFGLVFSHGISSLVFSTTDPYDNGQIDNLYYASAAAVPVPAALPLLASGLGALGFLGWRRKRSAGV